MWKEGFISVPDEKNEGKFTNCRYWVKVYDDEESAYGISGGKIVKLMIRAGDTIICNYDRGWDIKATTYEARFALKILLHEYN
jgi:hypothetical protein